MKRASAVFCCVFGVLSIARGGEGIPAKTLDELKRGTVFLRAKNALGTATGSGFLIHRDGTTGYLVTNWHVVYLPTSSKVSPKGTTPRAPAASVEAIFFSGAKGEASHKVEILAAIEEFDLAILRVRDAKDLPAPLSLATDAKLTETTTIFCLGFPFGKLLAVGGGNPATTISKGTISSLRTNTEGELVNIQIDGALNPGNSGGPVVDAQGRIVGVAVGAIPGAQIGLAIPAAHVTKLLDGRAGDPLIRIGKVDAAGAELTFEAPLADPFDKIKSVTLHYLKDGAAGAKPMKGQPKPLDGTAKLELTIKDQKATGTLSLKPDQVGLYWFQVAFTLKNDKTQHLQIASLKVEPKLAAKVVEPAPARPDWTTDLAKMKIPEKPATGFLFGKEITVDAVKLDRVGFLTLGQGKGFVPDASVKILLRLKAGEAIAGKTFEIATDAKPGTTTPAVHLYRKDPGETTPRLAAFSGKYALKLEFGKAENGTIPGRIYLCLPDPDSSFVAGTFVLKLE